MYIATKRMQAEGRWLEPGDAVPGVEEWPWQARHRYLANGLIRPVEKPKTPAKRGTNAQSTVR